MTYGSFRTGKQHELVRRVETLTRKQVESVRRRRFILSEARALRTIADELQQSKLTCESRTVAEVVIGYVDAIVPGRYSSRSTRCQRHLRLEALRLDTCATVLIPTQARKAMEEISGPNGMRHLLDLFPAMARFDHMLGELETLLDRFLESRLADSLRARPRELRAPELVATAERY